MVDEEVRDRVRALANTEAFQQSRRERKKVEMRFAYRIAADQSAGRASGHAAGPPSSDMNSRRLMWDMGASSPALCQ